MATMNRDRGQLLLIGALALAISLVAIALVLNSAVYTHNLASRADSPGDGVTTVTRDVRYGTGGLMDYSNEKSAGKDYSIILNNYTTGVPDIETAVARDAAVDGRIVRASHDTGSDHEGVRIVDAETGGSTFYPASGTPNEWWVTDDTHVRGFELAVQRSSLDYLGTSSVESALGTGDLLSVTDTPFTVAFDDGSNEWRVAIYNDTLATDTVSVTVRNVGANTYRTCSVDAAEVRIEFADHRIEGEQCAALSFFDDLSGTSDVVYYYGDSAVGQYELVADVPVDGPTTEVGPFTDAVDTANYGNACGNGNAGDGDEQTYFPGTSASFPRISPAIYAANVSTTFDGTDVTFSATQRVAPDELGPKPVAPRILAFDVTETDPDPADGEFTVSWAVADPNGDSVSVRLEVTEPDGQVKTFTPSGGSTTVNVDDESGEFDVRLVADDGNGNTRSVTQTHTDDGDETGCPP